MRVVGVDGCPGGWVATEYDTDAPALSARFHPTFVDAVLSYPHVACIGVDMPIGLTEGGARQCDTEARKRLGTRHVSVFSAPDPRLFDVPAFAEATARSVALTGKGISQQAFGILPKIAEVNRAMTPLLQGWIAEVHPEVSFAELAGSPIAQRKGSPEGYSERAALLSDALRIGIPSRALTRALARPAAPEDVLDALVAAWTAVRIARGTAVRIPAKPQIGTNGLRMEIAS